MEIPRKDRYKDRADKDKLDTERKTRVDEGTALYINIYIRVYTDQFC